MIKHNPILLLNGISLHADYTGWPKKSLPNYH